MSSKSSPSRTNKVAIIGAGMSGIAMGAQLRRILGHDNFEIFERGEDVGGTWSQNTYPNLSCDIASQVYSFSFYQNPNWSETFASQPEILAYLNSTVDAFDLRRHIRFHQKCLSARWVANKQLWDLLILDLQTNKTYPTEAKFLVTAVGVLNIPKGIDDIPVLKEFKGEVFHTAEWRDVEFEGKKVMVIGNGCSANQVIPWILENASPKSLVQLYRSEQWVAPKGNTKNGTVFKWVLRNIPFANRMYRLWTALNLDLGIFTFRINSLGNHLRQSAQSAIKGYMESTAAARFHDVLIPHYAFGAKRPVMDHGYLQTTHRDNFTIVKCDGVTTVTGAAGRTVVDQLGGEHEVDVIILANGFKTQELLTPMEIWADEQIELRAMWKALGGARAYMGVCTADFPNFFMLAGPNTLPTGNSTLHGIECSVVYILRLLRPYLGRRPVLDFILPRRQQSTFGFIVPRQDAEDRYNAWVQEQMKSLVYTKEVDTWYINKESGRNTLIWPGAQFSFWWSRCVRPVRMNDFIVERQGKAVVD